MVAPVWLVACLHVASAATGAPARSALVLRPARLARARPCLSEPPASPEEPAPSQPESGELSVPMTLKTPSATGRTMHEPDNTAAMRWRAGDASYALFTLLALLLVALKTGLLDKFGKGVLSPLIGRPFGRAWGRVRTVREVLKALKEAEAAAPQGAEIRVDAATLKEALTEATPAPTPPPAGGAGSDADAAPPAASFIERSPEAPGPAGPAGEAAAPAAPTPPADAPPEPSAMLTAELKAELRARDVPCGGIFDRRELEGLLSDARARGAGEERLAAAAGAEAGRSATAATADADVDVDENQLRQMLKSMPGGDAVDVDEAVATMQRAMADPQALSVLQDVATNPKCMQAMHELATHGDAAYAKYANDPEVMEALSKLTTVLAPGSK